WSLPLAGCARSTRRSGVHWESEAEPHRSRVLLATRSEGKLRELRPMFAAVGIDVIDLRAATIHASPHEDDLENALTFEENALAKARYFHRISGLPAVADDSGLEVGHSAALPACTANAGAAVPTSRDKRWAMK